MCTSEVESIKKQKNNTKDSNVVPHRSTNLARQCLTSLSRREAVLSLGMVVPEDCVEIKIYILIVFSILERK